MRADRELARGGAGTVSRALGRIAAALIAVPPVPWAFVTVLWMGLVRKLSDRPAGELPPPLLFGWLNNLAHAPLFGLLALWAWLALPRREGRPPTGRGAVLGLLVFVLLYGALDERLQASVPGREASAFDVLTDVTGAAAVLAVGLAVLSGRPDERTLRRRLGVGLLACVAAGALATFAPGA